MPAGAVDWRRDLSRFARLFDEGHLYDWNAVDWFCVKVLGPLIEENGLACAEAIAAWRHAENLWRARAARSPRGVRSQACPEAWARRG